MLETMRMEMDSYFERPALAPFRSWSRMQFPALSDAEEAANSRKAAESVVHSRVWCKTTAHNQWEIGLVQWIAANGRLACSIDNKVVEVESEETYPANPDILEGIDDLTKLSYLNEPSVLHNMRIRFEKDIIYTNAGPVLIAVNPFKKIFLYSSERVKIHRQNITNEPHVFALTDKACSALFKDGISQSIIISGESGAGKTETAKIAMQYIATVGGGRGVEDEILETNPILEAFGNAKTLRNDNSSRFGKLIDIYFDELGTICGAKIQTYLLEKSRVVHQAHGERSYHIFYQLCAGAHPLLREHLKLRDSAEYSYLSRSGCLKIDTVDDAEQFKLLQRAMDRVRISKADQTRLFEMLSAVLWLGNITFVSAGEDGHLTLADNEAAQHASSLLGCQVSDLGRALCTRKINARGEVIIQRLTEAQATDSRDALAKSIYASLFDWLVENINNSLEAGTFSKTKFISILDIYGFEAFERNSFEQLCINYANERLQQFFNHHLFKIEQEEYTSEAIDWTKIEFVDNQECLDLIEKRPLGLITLLDEECSFPKANEASFVMKLNEHLKGNTRFKPERSASFTVQHYAGEVTYCASGFLEKNRDLLHVDLLQFLGSCQHQLAQEFSSKLGSANGVDLQRRSVSTKFKNQLLNLMERLQSTSPHFIRCVKPNSSQQPEVFDAELVLHQLHCCGVLEVVRISRSGYPTRYSFEQFSERYGFLLGSELVPGNDHLGISTSVLRKFSVSPDAFQVGKTKIFFRPGQIGLLEHLRTRTLEAIVYIQTRIRGYNARRTYLVLRRSSIYLQSLLRRKHALKSLEYLKLVHRSSVTIQKFTRGKLARRQFQSLRRRWLASIVVQRHARGFLARIHYRQSKRIHRAVIIIQKNFRRFFHARRWSRAWKRRCSAATTLQSHVRCTLARRRYLRARHQVILAQAAARGWLCRKARAGTLEAESQRSEVDEEYVNISAVDLDMEVEAEETERATHVPPEAGLQASDPEVLAQSRMVAAVFELQSRLLETEKNLCKKEDENAELLMKLKLYEKRWSEYEDKMSKMEDLWQNQMVSLQRSLEAAKRSLATTGLESKQNDVFEIQSNGSRHRAARPMLPQGGDGEFDWDDTTSVGTRTPESTTTYNKEEQTVLENLVKEFEHRSQVFSDDIEFIVEVKSGQTDAELDPDMELRKLKQRFDIWKKDFKVQVRETKTMLQRLEASDRSRKRWWTKKPVSSLTNLA